MNNVGVLVSYSTFPPDNRIKKQFLAAAYDTLLFIQLENRKRLIRRVVLGYLNVNENTANI